MRTRLPGGDTTLLPLLPTVRPFRTVRYKSSGRCRPLIDAATGAAMKLLLVADRNAEAEARWLADAGFVARRAQPLRSASPESHMPTTTQNRGTALMQEASQSSWQWLPPGARRLDALAALRTGQYDLVARSPDYGRHQRTRRRSCCRVALLLASWAYLAAVVVPELVAERLRPPPGPAQPVRWRRRARTAGGVVD
jgi:hypothetical protein